MFKKKFDAKKVLQKKFEAKTHMVVTLSTP